jgi:hypothetical protein
MDTVAAPGRDAAQLLDIHMDQLAWVGARIAADPLPGRPVRSIQASRFSRCRHSTR